MIGFYKGFTNVKGCLKGFKNDQTKLQSKHENMVP